MVVQSDGTQTEGNDASTALHYRQFTAQGGKGYRQNNMYACTFTNSLHREARDEQEAADMQHNMFTSVRARVSMCVCICQ